MQLNKETNQPTKQDVTHGQFVAESCIKMFYHTRVEEPRLSYYLPLAGGRIIKFIPSSRYYHNVKCSLV